MNNILIQLRSKFTPSVVTDIIQLDSKTDVQTLTSLLNSMLNKSTSYIFYYNNERIVTNISSCLENFELNIEDAITVDYIDEKDIEADQIIESDDVITSLNNFKGTIFYSTYNGNVYTSESGKSRDILFKNIKGLFSSDSLYGYNDFNIFQILEKRLIHTLDEEIRTCSLFDNHIAIGTISNVYLLDLGNNQISLIAEDVDICRSILLQDAYIYWIQNHNQIIKYEINSKLKTEYNTNYTLTNLCLDKGNLLATTSDNKLIYLDGEKIRETDINIRLAQHGLASNSELILFSQHDVISNIIDYSSCSCAEMSFLRLESQITAVAADNQRIYVANGNKISIFEKSRLRLSTN